MRGFKVRLPHYKREIIKPHWHIDYMLKIASVKKILTFGSQTKTDCLLAKELLKQLVYLVSAAAIVNVRVIYFIYRF